MNPNSKCLCYFLATIGGGLLHGVCPGLCGKAGGLTDHTANWEGMHESSQPVFDTDALLKGNAKPSRQSVPGKSGKQRSLADDRVSETIPPPSSQKTSAKVASKSQPGDRSALERLKKKQDLGELRSCMVISLCWQTHITHLIACHQPVYKWTFSLMLHPPPDPSNKCSAFHLQSYYIEYILMSGELRYMCV